jgi:hypothetical protein
MNTIATITYALPDPQQILTDAKNEAAPEIQNYVSAAIAIVALIAILKSLAK